MTCIRDAALDQLRTDSTFKSWMQKLKDAYPDRTDDEIEKSLISFMNANNGNFPGYTPQGEESNTFKKLLETYNGDEVSAMEVYEHLFTKEFIEEFGDWCGITNTEGLTEDEIKKINEENQEKLSKAVLNDLGEPALFFVNSINHKASDASVAAINSKDENVPFKIVTEGGEARAIIGYDRPVQSGSITFIISKHTNHPISDSGDVIIDVDDVLKIYDFNSGNKGFTDKRLSAFTTQSSKDLYCISKQISKANGILKLHYKDIHSKEEAIELLKSKKNILHLVFDTDEDSPFGHIQFMEVPHNGGTAWQIISPEGIFYDYNRYQLSTSMTAKSKTSIDELAELFFINSEKYEAIKDYIISNTVVVRPDSYLSSPIVDYEDDHFILKPSHNRTQHNIKTELALSYAVYLFDNDQDKFKKYLNLAKQFPEIRQNSAGAGVIKDVNMIGNLIGSILSGQLIDDNYYTAHLFDQSAVQQAMFVSKNQKEIRKIVETIWKDMSKDIKSNKMRFLSERILALSEKYEKIKFSNVTNGVSRNRTASKLTEDDIQHSFCDSIDKVKSLYNYRRTDSGNKKMYDATEYTKIVSAYEQLNILNKQIKEYLVKRGKDDNVAHGENLERLIGQYFTCIETIINIMDDDISNIEYFIWHTPIKYTPEYYQSLLYIDRSIIKMYENRENKNIISALFNLDSNSSDLVRKSLYDIFDQKQIEKFELLRDRFYNNYTKLSNKRRINGESGTLESIIDSMIGDAIQHICDDWCNKNLKCTSEAEEQWYRENLKLDIEGHVMAGMPLDTFIGGAASSGHSIINVLYRIIQTQGKRSNLLIKQKGDSLLKLFKETFDNHSIFNQCKQFCEMVDGKTTGYFIRAVNYGQYYRAKVAKQRELLKKLPECFTINEDKSTSTKLVIEWGIGSEKYQNQFLDDMDVWIEQNANRRYKAQYYIERRRILCQERNGIQVGNEAANRQNTLRRQIDGIKNRYRDKKSGVFLPFKVPPVQKKILDRLEHQLQDLSSPYERYTDEEGNQAIREKTGLDLAIALNIRDWNKFIQDKRNYTQDVDRYNEVEEDLRSRIGKGITKEDYDAFVAYYHTTRAKQEYYDAIEKKYKGKYGDYERDIEEIHFKRRSILSRVKYGPKGLLQFPNLDELEDAEWEELKQLDIEESRIKNKIQDPFNTTSGISSRLAVPVPGADEEISFIKKHRDEKKLHTYIDDQKEEQILSVYYVSVPNDESLIEEALTGEFSTEASEYMNSDFDPKNSSYEQPKEYDDKGKKLYKNDKYDEIKENDKLFRLYEEFLNIMKEANEMFGYAAVSSNYKLPQIYEREASVYLSRGCSLLNSFIYKMKREYLVDERDFDRSYTSDIHADNTTSGKLRKRFVDMLSDPEHISTDLVYSVMAYYTTACRYSDKQDVQAQCELINRKIQSLDQKSYGSFRTQADNTVETFLFENTMNTDSSVIAIFERFMEHTTAVLLKSKLKTALKAFIDGYRLLTNVMLSNKWNARGHFLIATRRALAQTFSSIRSSVDVLDYNLSEALMSLNNINIQSFQDSNKTKFTRAYYRSGLMPMLTMIDHVTTKSIMLTVYDSLRLYNKPDGTKQFLNINEYVNAYRKDHPEVDKKKAKKQAEKLFWKEKVTLYDAYQLGKHDKNGEIIEGTENILYIKDEYVNMFSKDKNENEEMWAILQTRVEGQIDQMAASINGYKPEDTKGGNAMRVWYLKPISQIRSFLVANYNDLFKHSTALKHMVPDQTTRNTNQYIPERQHSENKTTEWLNKMWSADYSIVQFFNKISSEREMYNVLTGTKDVGYYFGTMSMIRKTIENLIIYAGSIYNKQDPDYRDITDAEKTSVINMFIVIAEGVTFYNIAVFIGGLLTCLLGQGSAPDDEDEYFVHWILWLLYDLAGSMVNDTFVNIPTGDTIVDIFKNIMAMVPAMDQFKKSFLNSNDALTFVEALFGAEDTELFEDPEYGTDSSPFNLIKSGKWQGEMYGKRRFYEVMQNAPWLIAPWWLDIPIPVAPVISSYLPPLPLANLKESFSAPAAKAKASYTFNNLSPIDYLNLGTPSSSDESYDKFHNYGKWTTGARLLNSLLGGYEGEEEVLDFIRNLSKNPYSPVPKISPVDKVERMIPLGREYDE